MKKENNLIDHGISRAFLEKFDLPELVSDSVSERKINEVNVINN